MQESLSTRSIDFFVSRVNGATQSLTGLHDATSPFPRSPGFLNTSFIKPLLPESSPRSFLRHQPATVVAQADETHGCVVWSDGMTPILLNAKRRAGFEPW